MLQRRFPTTPTMHSPPWHPTVLLAVRPAHTRTHPENDELGESDEEPESEKDVDSDQVFQATNRSSTSARSAW